MSSTTIAYESMVMSAVTARHARYRPHHTAVVIAPGPRGEREIRLSWREFDAYVNRWANALTTLGVGRGDRVATVLPNSLELLATFWSCAKLGAIIVPVSPLLTATGLNALIGDAHPRVLVGTSDQLAVLDHLRTRAASGQPPIFVLIDAAADDEAAAYRAFGTAIGAASDAPPDIRVSPDDVWTLMYTSGTTGLPKGIPLTHFIRSMSAARTGSWRMAPESVVLHSGSIVFNGAMTTMLPSFALGCTYVLQRAFDAGSFVETVERERVTHTMLVPSQIIAILNAPAFNPLRLESLQMILSLGAPLHETYKDRLSALLPRRFYELYGLTEGFVTILDRDDVLRKPGSVGVPPAFYSMQIVDDDGNELPARQVGEIVGRGPITMPGYYRKPEETARTLRDGWLHTGDLGYVDDDGFLYLVDRKKDMIDSGGIKVYPKDIEEIAARHPMIHEVAVFGIPHEKWGETPVAAVLLKQKDCVSGEELREWINARVSAKYQRVDRVLVLDRFPRNAAGKTLKVELRAPFWEEQGRKI